MLVLMGCGKALGQAATTANATVTIVPAIKIVKVSDLLFGAFLTGIAGTITVNPAGVRSVAGLQVLTNATYPVSAAAFTVTGSANFFYTITLPTTVNITEPKGTSLVVNQFVSSPGSTGTLSSGGSSTLSIGATLTVGASATAAAYSGSFTVTVNYQ